MTQRGRVAKPARSAIASTVSSLSSSSAGPAGCAARSASVCGVVPVSCTKRRAKVRSDMFARAASWRYGQWLVQVRAQPLEQLPQGPVTGRGDRLVDVLRLAAVAMRRQPPCAGRFRWRSASLLLPDQGRGTRRCRPPCPRW